MHPGVFHWDLQGLGRDSNPTFLVPSCARSGDLFMFEGLCIGLNCTFSLCWTRWLSVTIWRQPVMHEKLCYGTFRPTWHGLKTFCLTNMAWSKKQLATLETAQLHLKRHEMFQGQLIWSQKIFWNFWNYSTDPSTVVRPLKGTEQRKHSV